MSQSAMIYGAALTFDAGTEREVRRLWQSTVDAGMPSVLPQLDYEPHMTLALAETLDVPALRADVLPWLAEQRPLAVQFSALGVFLGDGDAKAAAVITLEPVVNRALLDLHERLYALILRNSTNIPPYYAPGAWSPHVTVGFRVPPDQIGRQVEVLRSANPPREGKITGLMFGGFRITGGSRLEMMKFGGTE